MKATGSAPKQKKTQESNAANPKAQTKAKVKAKVKTKIKAKARVKTTQAEELQVIRERSSKRLDELKKTTATGSSAAVYQILGLESGKATKPLTVKVSEGLPVNTVERLADSLEMPSVKLVEHYLKITRPTMTRRRQKGALSSNESDRTVRFARLLLKATAMMEGDSKAANRWLSTPQDLLGGNTPLEYATTEVGAHEVEQLIGRLEYGVYS